MNNSFLKIGSIFGFAAVLLGAFGSHALQAQLLENGNLETYKTAVSYQFYHGLALILTGILKKEFNNKWLVYAGFSFVSGTVIFSGSLYLLCFTNIKLFGAVAPIGGSLLLFAWIFLFLSLLKNR